MAINQREFSSVHRRVTNGVTRKTIEVTSQIGIRESRSAIEANIMTIKTTEAQNIFIRRSST
jgi:hypothetical protein